MKSFSITKRYHLFSLIMLMVPMLIMTFAVVNLFHQTVIDKFRREQFEILSSIEENSINYPVSTIEDILLNYKNDPRLFSPEDDQKKQLANEWKNLSLILGWELWIYYIDRNGEIISSRTINNQSEITRQLWKNIESSSILPYWVELHHSKINGENVLSSVLTVQNENKAAGIIGLDISLNSFFSKIKYDDLRKGTKILGMTPQGEIINFNRNSDEPIEYSTLYDWQTLTKKDQKWQLITLESGIFFSFYEYLDKIDIYLVSLVPGSLYKEEIKPLLFVLVTIIILSFFLALAGSYLVTRRLLNNISQLNLYISDVTEGNFTPRICVKGEDEFLDLNMHLNHMVQSLGDNIDLRETLLHLISHNSATPITLLLNNSYDLINSEPEKEVFKQIYTTSQNLKNLMDNIILYLRLEEGGRFANNEYISLKETSEFISRVYQPVCKKKNLVFDIEMEDPKIRSNRFLIQMALENLIDNAVKYSNPEGKIKIRSYTRENAVYWTISDNGPGISPDETDLLFRRFSKISTQPTGGEKSTGLGLFLVKKMMLRIGGDIQYSPEDKSFILNFPA